MERFIINIVCLGHSGSTLIGNILGSHSMGLHIGEVVSPLKKKRPIVCRHCLSQPCPIWGCVITESYLKEVYRNFVAYGNARRMSLIRRIFFTDYSGGLYLKLFDKFHKKRFIVDSSKNINWYRYNAKNRRLSTKYIFLKRNVNAVLAAYKRGYQSHVSDYFDDINKSVASINNFYNEVAVKDRVVISYEDFIHTPLKHLKRLSEFAEIEYEPEMMNLKTQVHHLIGGNQGLLIQTNPSKAQQIDDLVKTKTPVSTIKYYANLDGLELDERWKDELTSFEIQQIDRGIVNKIEF